MVSSDSRLKAELKSIIYCSVSQPWSWAPPNTAHFVCLPNQTHLIQLISGLEETPGPEMVSEKRDIQNVQCWGAPRTRVEKHWSIGTNNFRELLQFLFEILIRQSVQEYKCTVQEYK